MQAKPVGARKGEPHRVKQAKQGEPAQLTRHAKQWLITCAGVAVLRRQGKALRDGVAGSAAVTLAIARMLIPLLEAASWLGGQVSWQGRWLVGMLEAAGIASEASMG